MESTGISMFGGGTTASLHLNLPTADHEAEIEEEEADAKKREEEIRGILANAFDDLDESYEPSHYSRDSHRELGPMDYHPNDYCQEKPATELENGFVDEVSPWSDNSCYSLNGNGIGANGDTVNSDLDRSFANTDIHAGKYNYNKGHTIPASCPTGVNACTNDEQLAPHTALEQQYRVADTSMDQIHLLYEARGKEIDQLTETLESLHVQSNQRIRMLQHQLTLMTNEKAETRVEVSRLNTLVNDYEGKLKEATSKLQDLHGRNSSMEAEKRRLVVQLEGAKGDISNLECQLIELQGASTLTKSRQHYDDFVNKLRAGHNNEKESLLQRAQEAELRAQGWEKDVEFFRLELHQVRRNFEEQIGEKSETNAKLTACLEAAQRQITSLLQYYQEQDVAEMVTKCKSLQTENGHLVARIGALEEQLLKAREELERYDRALKLGVISNHLPTMDDSIQSLGLRKMDGAPTMVSSVTPDIKKSMAEEELVKSLLAIKLKREEIDQLHTENAAMKVQIQKLQNALQSAHLETTELQMKISTVTQNQEKEKVDCFSVLSENSCLKEEIVQLYKQMHDLELASGAISKELVILKENFTNALHSSGDPVNKGDSVSKVLELTKAIEKHTEAVNLLISKEKDTVSQLTQENTKLVAQQFMWDGHANNITKLLSEVKDLLQSIGDHQIGEHLNEVVASLVGQCSTFAEMKSSLGAEYENLKLELLLLRKQQIASSNANSSSTQNLTALPMNSDKIMKEELLKFRQDYDSKYQAILDTHAQDMDALKHEYESQIGESRQRELNCRTQMSEMEVKCQQYKKSRDNECHKGLALKESWEKFKSEIAQRAMEEAKEIERISDYTLKLEGDLQQAEHEIEQLKRRFDTALTNFSGEKSALLQKLAVVERELSDQKSYKTKYRQVQEKYEHLQHQYKAYSHKVEEGNKRLAADIKRNKDMNIGMMRDCVDELKQTLVMSVMEALTKMQQLPPSDATSNLKSYLMALKSRVQNVTLNINDCSNDS